MFLFVTTPVAILIYLITLSCHISGVISHDHADHGRPKSGKKENNEVRINSNFSSSRRLQANNPNPNVMLALFGYHFNCLEDLPFIFKDESEDPYAFFSYYESQKDFKSYFTRSDEDSNLDYTDLLEVFKAPCEFNGGILYSISGSQTCNGDANADPDAGKTFRVKNLPYCALTGCNVNQTTVEDYGNSNGWNFCTSSLEQSPVTYEVKQPAHKSILTEQCHAQMLTFTLDIPAPLLTYNRLIINEFATTGDGLEYDYSPSLAHAASSCEEEGGYLYKFSEKVTGNEFNKYDERGITFLNYPMCLGSSCNAQKYFEQVFVPTSRFELEGDFRHKNFGFLGDGSFAIPRNETYPARQYYRFLGFEAVSDVGVASESAGHSIAGAWWTLGGVFAVVGMVRAAMFLKKKKAVRKLDRVQNLHMLKGMDLI